MTDLEITKLCAEAMSISVVEDGPQSESPEHWLYHDQEDGWREYDPLHDDAQAMALVKKFRLGLFFQRVWVAHTSASPENGHCDDLNRAICECVAKMQAAKK